MLRVFENYVIVERKFKECNVYGIFRFYEGFVVKREKVVCSFFKS